MKNEHIARVFKNMQHYLGENGCVTRVSRETRAAAIASADSLGLSPQEHAEVMQKIQELHQEHGKEKARIEIEKLEKDVSI